MRASGGSEPQQGQGVVEYALVIALFAVTLVVMLMVLGDQIANLLTAVYESIASLLNGVSNLISRE